MVSLDAHTLDAVPDRRSRGLLDDEGSSAAYVHGLGLVEEVDVEAVHDLDEVAVDDLEVLVVALQDLDELGRGGEQPFWYDGVDEGLRRAGDFGNAGSVVRRPQEDDAER